MKKITMKHPKFLSADYVGSKFIFITRDLCLFTVRSPTFELKKSAWVDEKLFPRLHFYLMIK